MGGAAGEDGHRKVWPHRLPHTGSGVRGTPAPLGLPPIRRCKATRGQCGCGRQWGPVVPSTPDPQHPHGPFEWHLRQDTHCPWQTHGPTTSSPPTGQAWGQLCLESPAWHVPPWGKRASGTLPSCSGSCRGGRAAGVTEPSPGL